MAPKKAATQERQLPPSILDNLFPVWNDAGVAGEKDASAAFEDPAGCLLPQAAEPFLDEWKRTRCLVLNRPDVSMIDLEDASADGIKGAAGGNPRRNYAGEVFAGHPAFEWLLTVFRAVEKLKTRLPTGHYMWELIHPKDKDGMPCKVESGKYSIKLFIMDHWRQVVIDDQIPVDLFGRPLFVGIRPLQLWPLLLSKAILKVMEAYRLLEKSSPDEVPAFHWLTGWPQEDLSHPLSGVQVEGGARFDRLEEVVKRSLSSKSQETVTICCLKRHAAAERALPRLVVFCGPAGVGKGRLMDLLEETMGERFAKTISHTTRRPKEHEEHGKDYFFVTRDEMDAAIQDSAFLEMAEVTTSMGTNVYGTSLATVREVSATGKLCLMGMDLQGVQELQRNERVDGLYIYLAPPSMQVLEDRLRERRMEAKSTTEKRLQWAEQEVEKSAKPQLFDHVIDNFDIESTYTDIKEAISSLSPIIRNRLRGLPPYVLDYSDLIPSNSVEKPFLKPVLLCGPTTGEKDIIIQRLVTEFPDVFGLPRRHTTLNKTTIRHQHTNLAEELDSMIESVDFGCDMDSDVILTKEKFEAYVNEKKFVEYHTDLHVHSMIREQHGLTHEDMQHVLSQGKLCLLDVESDSVELFRSANVDCFGIFLKPPSMEEYKHRLDNWTRFPEPVIQRMLENATREQEQVKAFQVFDQIVVNDDIRDTLDEVKDVISKFRPDIIPPKDENRKNNEVQSALFLCGPMPWMNEDIIKRLRERIPDKTALPVLHTNRLPEKGEPEGVEFYFLKPDLMDTMEQNGEFVFVSESPVTGHKCGVSWDEIQRIGSQGKMAAVNCPLKGVEAIREKRLARALCILMSRRDKEAVEDEIRRKFDGDDENREALEMQLEEAERYFGSACKPKLFDHIFLDDDPEILYADVQDGVAAHSPAVASTSHKPLVVVGPFGTGKRLLLQQLFDEYEQEFLAPTISSSHPRSETIEPGEAEAYETDTRENILKNIQDGKTVVAREVLGGVYGIKRSSVRRIQALGKVCVMDLDLVEDVKKLRDENPAVNILFMAPEKLDMMRKCLEKEVYSNPPLGYEVDEACNLFHSNAVQEIETANESQIMHARVDINPDAMDASYCQLLEAISNWYPSVIPPSNVWGYGRPLWDESCRVYGHRPLKVIVLGPAACGKTTLCTDLSRSFDIPRINVGELLYKEIQDGTPLGLESKKYMDASKTVSDDIFLRLVSARINSAECDVSGWLLDGFPHTQEQAEKLVECGIVPDKVIFLSCQHATLLDRAKCRKIDPLTGDVYRIPPPGHKIYPQGIQPTHKDGSVNKEILSRLTLRHDDVEENVLKRLQTYDEYYKGLRTAFSSISITVDACVPPENLRDSAVEFITVEHIHNVDPVPSWVLKDAAYEVIEVLKYKREPLICLQQTDGKVFWVTMEELAGNTKCLLLHQDPEVFSTSQSVVRANLEEFAGISLLHVESSEPVRMLASLSVGIQYPMELKDTKAGSLLVVTGPSCSGKSTIIDVVCEKYPEKVERLCRVGDCMVGKGVEVLDKKEFSHRVRTDKLACAYELYGVQVGVMKEEIERARSMEKLCLLELDPPGCADLRQAGIDFKLVALSVDLEVLDRRMRQVKPPLQEEEIQKRLHEAALYMSDSAKQSDHVISADELPLCRSAFMEVVCDYWPLPVVPSKCNILVDFYEWGRGMPMETCKHMSCVASQATTIDLSRGKHLLGIHIDQEFLHCVRFLSNTPFQIEDASNVLQEQRALSVQQFQGDHNNVDTGSWCLLFRYRYSIPEACKVSACLKLNMEAAQRFVKLFVINNDDGSDVSHLLGEMLATQHSPNKKGYSLIGLVKNGNTKGVEAGRWRLTVTSEKPIKLQEQMANRMASFSGDYIKNHRNIVCRYKLTPSTATQICLHAKLSVEYPFLISILSPQTPGGAFEWETTECTVFSRTAKSALLIPNAAIEAGSYIIQLAVEGDDAQTALEDGACSWTLEVAPSSEEKDCPISVDDTKEKFLQGTIDGWNLNGKGGKDRPRNAVASLTNFRDAVEKTETLMSTREVGKGEIMELDPVAHLQTQNMTANSGIRLSNGRGENISGNSGHLDDDQNVSPQGREDTELQIEEECRIQQVIKESVSSFQSWRERTMEAKGTMDEKLWTRVEHINQLGPSDELVEGK